MMTFTTADAKLEIRFPDFPEWEKLGHHWCCFLLVVLMVRTSRNSA
jgi:hypothetical protein